MGVGVVLLVFCGGFFGFEGRSVVVIVVCGGFVCHLFGRGSLFLSFFCYSWYRKQFSTNRQNTL